MAVGDYCNRDVVVIDHRATVKAAADLMRRHHVGDLVLVDEAEERRVPRGIVTDRDLVVEVMAQGLAPEDFVVADLVTEPLLRVHEEDSLFDALEVMRARGVRRVPVVSAEDELVGLITSDDVIGIVAEALDDLSAVVQRQRQREESTRP